jgi:hypothetical protein
VFDQTVSVSGDGSYTSPSVHPGPGRHPLVDASYGGETNNNQAATGSGSVRY